MRIKIILLIIACSIGINSFSQSEHYKLEISGDNRDIRNFNSNSIGVLIKTSVENDKIAFSMEITNNPDNQYKFYLFDEVASSKNSSNSIKSIWELKDWAEGIVKDELNKKDDAKINFDGNFINYNKQLLSRTLWSRSGYFGFKEITDANFDSYTLVANKVSELTDFSVAYIFMITDVKRSGEIVIGLTNPVIHIIPYNIVNELFKEFDKEVSIAVADQKVEDKVKDSDIGVEEKADLETEEKTSERIETKIEAGKVTKEEIKEDNVKKEVDKCSDLQNRFNNINSSIGRSDSGINWLDKLITDGIKEYRDQIGKCDNIDCFNEIKEKFDKEEWDKSLINTEDELNRQSRAVSALRQDKNFNACSINTSALISRINNLKQKRQSIEDEVEIIKVEIESKLIDQNAFNETVEKYKSEVSLIVDLYNQYNNLFNKYDDKFFNYRTLEKLEIKNLMDASIKIDSTKNKISDIITKAEILYREKTSQKDYFPEATFRKETGLSINTGDWENLKKEIDDLIKKAIESKPNNLFKIIIIGFIVLLLLIGGYAYFMGVVRGKIKNKLKNGSRQKNSKLSRVAEAGAIDSNSEPDGIEIIEDDNEINKGSGLDLVRKLAGIKYYEIDVQSFIQDTAVRKVYFCDDFVIKAYRYFEDKMLHFGNKSIDDLYEYGGFIIGKWAHSLYDKDQYDLSLEQFVEPGEDAKFSKFNIDFGYDISFRMEEMLIDMAKQGNEQVFVGWLHSHPGHNVFLSNYDIEVQETFRNQYHPNRHIALVLEPTTTKWDLGLFTFKSSGEMNNKEDVKSLLSFHEIYSWAIGKNREDMFDGLMNFIFEGATSLESESVSFDRTALLRLKMIVERELTVKNAGQKYYFQAGIVANKSKIGNHLHILNVHEPDEKDKSVLNNIGIFTGVTDENQLESLHNKFNVIIQENRISVLLAFQLKKDKFVLIPLKSDGQPDKKDNWIEFPKSDILPFLSK